MNVPRKKPAVRLFIGLAGRFTPEEKPSLEIASPPAAVPAIPAIAQPSPESIAALEQEILAAKKKRGRPRIHVDDAAKMRSHRKTKKDAAKEKAIQDEIDAILKVKPESNDLRGRIHGETSGGDALFVAERVDTYAWVDINGQRHENGGRKRPNAGMDPKAFEDGLTQKETDYTWVNQQNFNAAAKWDKRDKEIFTLHLADVVCIRGDAPRCRLCDFNSAWFQDVRAHFIGTHRAFIRAEIKRCKPNPAKLEKSVEKNIVTKHENA
ncbi:MAG TPA: hypothetical protein VK709_19080 [Candidatus Saccharimonadales bacterium]|jgi:hypothetical protein|nr:hypothetical protein [Candidatus Saccharimonadales bacterium]